MGIIAKATTTWAEPSPLGASGVLESDFEISGACEVTVSYGLKETKNSQWEQAEGTLILYESDGCWYVDPNALAGF